MVLGDLCRVELVFQKSNLLHETSKMISHIDLANRLVGALQTNGYPNASCNPLDNVSYVKTGIGREEIKVQNGNFDLSDVFTDKYQIELLIRKIRP